MNALFETDAYKLSHAGFMNEGTNMIYSNLTARSSKWFNCNRDDYDEKVSFFGLQYFIKDFLLDEFNKSFFHVPKEKALARLKRRFDSYLGKDSVDIEHFGELHDLGYLPIEIRAFREGSVVPIRVPMMTIHNTHPRFAWLTNYLETVISQELWQPITGATISREFRKLCEKYADKTCDDKSHVQFQCHNFSARGMAGRHAAAIGGAAHLAYFVGTDTVSSIDLIEAFYNADATKEFISTSVPATEHSISCLGIATDGELETFRRWITKDYPTGIVSMVSDTIDHFRVLTEYLPQLKDDILNRKPDALGLSKVVIRPDSGVPEDIICGTARIHKLNKCESLDDAKDWAEDILVEIVSDETAHGECGDYSSYGYFEYDGTIYKAEVEIEWNRHDKQYYYIDGHSLVSFEPASLTPEEKGSIEILWEIFGGTYNSKGYKVLDSHIGLIYGDSITLPRLKEIFSRLEEKGFASSNVVVGIGSFSLSYNSRDSLGMAIKATYAEVNGVGYNLFKDPKTDSGTKKSAKGLLKPVLENGIIVCKEEQTWEQLNEPDNLHEVIFKNGELVVDDTFSDIRDTATSGV